MCSKKRKVNDGSCVPSWEIEATRRLAIWRQQLPVVKTIAYGEIVAEVARQKNTHRLVRMVVD